jgi:hypothetical protein
MGIGLDPSTLEKLNGYCKRHYIPKVEAVRRGVHLLLTQQDDDVEIPEPTLAEGVPRKFIGTYIDERTNSEIRAYCAAHNIDRAEATRRGVRLLLSRRDEAIYPPDEMRTKNSLFFMNFDGNMLAELDHFCKTHNISRSRGIRWGMRLLLDEPES